MANNLTLYNRVVLPILRGAALVGSFWNPKLRLGIAGRRKLQTTIKEHYELLPKDRTRVLIHVASFGELEQAKPVIERLRQSIPNLHIHLTFFSPSGYANAYKKYLTPDLITYAPFDSGRDVARFLDIAKPDLALFVRYDLWPNMAHELKARNIPSILFSATFDPKRENRLVRKLHQETYNQLSAILTITELDQDRFEKFATEVPKIAAIGDTRFDQVLERKARMESLGEHPLQSKGSGVPNTSSSFVLVAGSTWREDEALLEKVFRSVGKNANLLLIIAPHEPTQDHIRRLSSNYGSRSILLSQAAKYTGEKVIIVDSIGKLFGLYQYADAAYVGGGFGKGVHNVLEPAVWGKPVVVGPNHKRSQEVQLLIHAGGAQAVKTEAELKSWLTKVLQKPEIAKSTGKAAQEFVRSGSGATEKILAEILTHHATRQPG